MTNRNPFIAAIINFFLWGLGYIYFGKRTVFGYFIFIGFLFLRIPLFYIADWAEMHRFFISIGYIIMSFAFAFDVFELAKVKNPQIKKAEPKTCV